MMRRIPLLVTVALLALAMGVVGAVSASPDAKKHSKKEKAHATLTVLTKPREIRVVDLGARGATHGDMRVLNSSVYNATGTKRIGRLDLFCVATDPADEPAEQAHMAECTVTYTLPGGELSTQGVNTYPRLPELPPRGVDAIVGGTGKYAGVGREQRFETRGNKLISTFRFID